MLNIEYDVMKDCKDKFDTDGDSYFMGYYNRGSTYEWIITTAFVQLFCFVEGADVSDFNASYKNDCCLLL